MKQLSIGLIVVVLFVGGCDQSATTNDDSLAAALVAVDDRLAAGEFAQALQQLDAIQQRTDLSAAQSSDVLVDRSVALLQLDRAEEAAKALDNAIAQDQKNAVAYLNRGALRLTNGQALAAQEDFDVAIELDPEDPAAYRNRSLAWVALNQLDAAYVDLSSAMQRSEFDAELFLERAAIWDAKGNEEYAALNELIYATSENLSTYGQDPAVLLERGLTWFALGESAQAEADLLGAIELDATQVPARLVLGQLYWELEQPVPALAQFSAVLGMDKLSAQDRLDALLGRANAAQLQGDCAAATTDYRNILSQQPTHAGGTIGLGWVLLNCGKTQQQKPQQALQLAQNFLQASDADAWQMAELMAAAHAALGHRDQAREVLRQALGSASLPNPSAQREQLLRAAQEYAVGA